MARPVGARQKITRNGAGQTRAMATTHAKRPGLSARWMIAQNAGVAAGCQSPFCVLQTTILACKALAKSRLKMPGKNGFEMLM